MKQCAICENHLFQKAYAKGKKFVTSTLALYVLPDLKAGKIQKQNPAKEKKNRVGLTATKKIGHAVNRNHAKRLMRESYRLLDKEKNLKKGFLVVIAAREKINDASFEEVKSDLALAMEKVGLLLNP